MTKIDMLDDVIEILIKRVMESETQKNIPQKKALKKKGVKINGLPSASGKRE